MKVGNLKFDNSNVGSNSPKSFNILSDKFSVECSSSLAMATSMSTSLISKTVSSTFNSGSGSCSIFNVISWLLAATSECLEIVGFKFSTDNSNSYLSISTGIFFLETDSFTFLPRKKL